MGRVNDGETLLFGKQYLVKCHYTAIGSTNYRISILQYISFNKDCTVHHDTVKNGQIKPATIGFPEVTTTDLKEVPL